MARDPSLPDVSSPLALDVRSLSRRPGTMRELSRTVAAPSRIGLDLVAVEEGTDLDLELRLEAVVEGVLVSGRIAGATAGECSRCLDPVHGAMSVHIGELFAYASSATDTSTDADEVYRIVDDLIDLEPVIIDAVGLGLPLQPVCRPDCPGLCSTCGEKLAVVGSDHSHEILDPRWAALASFPASEPGAQGPSAESLHAPTQDVEEK